jgi:hypothetical protein
MNLRCYVCGTPLLEEFNLIQMSSIGTSVFVFCLKCPSRAKDAIAVQRVQRDSAGNQATKQPSLSKWKFERIPDGNIGLFADDSISALGIGATCDKALESALACYHRLEMREVKHIKRR